MLTTRAPGRERNSETSSAFSRLRGKSTLSLFIAILLLALFIGWNEWKAGQIREGDSSREGLPDREQLPDTAGWECRRLAFHDFEAGNPADTALRLSDGGHSGRQALRLKPWAPFSPGLWIRFADLQPSDTAWILASGWVYFPAGKEGVKAYLVATCNHNGVNYKYMYIDLGKERLVPGKWNRVSIHYRIPRAPHPGDVLQAYFWYRGEGEMRVDDVAIEYFIPKPKGSNNHPIDH